jgi:hypothetical protein
MSQSRPDPDLSADLLALVLEIRDRIVAIERHVMVRDASRDALRDGTNRRARAYRKRQKEQKLAKANDVACERDASRDGAVFSLQSPNSNHVKILSKEKEEKKESKKESIRARARGTVGRGTRLEKSAFLTIEYFDTALALGVSRDRIPGLWAEFVDYWCAVPGQRGIKLDWLATWRNRLRHVGNGNGSNGHGRRKTNLDVFAELDAHIERLASAERGETTACEPLRENPVRLLWTK